MKMLPLLKIFLSDSKIFNYNNNSAVWVVNKTIVPSDIGDLYYYDFNGTFKLLYFERINVAM
jgi:hypothetical protein